MKKVSIVLFVLFFATMNNSFAQTDFYAGKWEIAIFGSPLGDVTFATDLTRKDGKLTGELVSGDDKRPITKIEESATKLIIYFMSSQGNEIFIDLSKVNENTLKGTLMDYEANAKRVKESDFFAGKWELLVIGTPNGDSKMIANFTRKDGKLEGELTSTELKEAIPMTSVKEEGSKITFGFTAQGYDVSINLEKVDDNNMKGMLMNMFESKAVRIK